MKTRLDSAGDTGDTGPAFHSAVERIARDVASAHAGHVDAAARFPKEAIDALRDAGLLAAPIPSELGGLGASMVELARACAALAQSCASSGMVFAMHCIKVWSLARHAGGTPELPEYLVKVAREQRLVASVTSEVGTYGDLRRSRCAVEGQGAGLGLIKRATTVSYGQHADDLVLTARRGPQAAASDQVLVVAPRGTFTLSAVGTWDTLGMRGTCSPSATVTVQGADVIVVAEPFARIASCSMVPASHALWGACWLGIAQDAVARATALVRAQAREEPSVAPRAAQHLPELSRKLQLMRDTVFTFAADYDRLHATGSLEQAESVSFALRANNLKLTASQLCVELVLDAMQTCGMAAYKNDSPYALGRHLRDSQSAQLMINNDRLRETNAALLLVHKGG